MTADTWAARRGRPVWFGPDARRRHGWLHTPDDGRATAGVVLCPPLAYEHTATYRTFRRLAELLAASGMCALRFDYDGTGDSVGDHRDPDRVGAWRASVADALTELRSRCPAPVVVAGMRVGALLAAHHAAEHGDADGLVVWDPVASGKAFLRELRTLGLMGVDAPADEPRDDGAVEAAGMVFTQETAAAMRELGLPDATVRVPVLALLRGDRPTPKALVEWVTRLPDSTLVDAVDQAELLDVMASLARVPDRALDSIAGWLVTRFGAGTPTAVDTASMPEQVVVATAAGGEPVVERAVSLGDNRLFAMVAEPAGGARTTVVCLNNAVQHHVGPGRLWVDWGRSLASFGIRAVRADFGGIGDSPPHPGFPEDRPYPLHAVDDVACIVSGLQVDPRHVVLAGLCSGALVAVTAAEVLGVGGVLAVNAAFHVKRLLREDVTAGDLDDVNPPRDGPGRRLAKRVVPFVPGAAWWVLDKLHLYPSRARHLQALAARGVDTLLVYGDGDPHLEPLLKTSAWHVRRLERRSGLRVVVVPGLDHGMLLPARRAEVADVMTAQLAAWARVDRPLTPAPRDPAATAGPG